MATVATNRKGNDDRLLLYLALALLVIGVALVLDTSYITKADVTIKQDPFGTLKRQGISALIGIFAMFLTSRFPYWRLRTAGPLLMAIALTGLALVLIPALGQHAGGARRWLGPTAIRVQPSEFAKFAVVVYLAGILARNRNEIREPWIGFLPPVAVIGITFVLIDIEPDLGTASVVLAAGMSMLYLGGAKVKHIAITIGLAGMLVLASVSAHHYRADRIRVWLNPVEARQSAGGQVVQGLVAVSTGGPTGRGLAKGHEKHYLFACDTDYIFATLAEETGLIGTTVLIGLYTLLVCTGLRVARRCTDPFGSLLASGLTLTVGWQALINIAVVTNSIPSTGVPLPLVSYGGTSLVIVLMGLGVLINIARSPAPRPRPYRRGR